MLDRGPNSALWWVGWDKDKDKDTGPTYYVLNEPTYYVLNEPVWFDREFAGSKLGLDVSSDIIK